MRAIKFLTFFIPICYCSLLPALQEKVTLLRWPISKLENKWRGTEISLRSKYSVRYLEENLRNITDIGERALLELYYKDSRAEFTREFLSTCLDIEVLRNELIEIFQRDEVDPRLKAVKKLLKIPFQIKLSQVADAFAVHSCKNEASGIKKKTLLRQLKLFKTTIEQIVGYFNPNDRNDVFTIKDKEHSESALGHAELDEELVGKLIGESICNNIQPMIEDGNLSEAINEISNILSDFGVLLMAYATGLTLCSVGLGAVICAFSIIVSGAGTAVFISRIYYHLDQLLKVFQE